MEKREALRVDSCSEHPKACHVYARAILIVWPLTVQKPILWISISVHSKPGTVIISPHHYPQLISPQPLTLCIKLRPSPGSLPALQLPLPKSQPYDLGHRWLQPSPPLELSNEHRYGAFFFSSLLKASLTSIYYINTCTGCFCIGFWSVICRIYFEIYTYMSMFSKKYTHASS